MNTNNNILYSLRAENGQLTLHLDKKSMIESKTNSDSKYHFEIRTRSVRLIVGQLIDNEFYLQFATTFVEMVEKNIHFEDKPEIELYFEWSDNHYKILKDELILFEKNDLPTKSPGGSIEIDIMPMLNDNNNLQYILDIGDKDNLLKERISLYIDEQFNLNLKILDSNGRGYFVTHPKSEFWKPDTFFKIICSWNQEYMKVRTFNIENEKNFDETVNINLDNIDLFFMPINPPLIIGTDLSQKYFCKMKTTELKLFDSPII